MRRLLSRRPVGATFALAAVVAVLVTATLAVRGATLTTLLRAAAFTAVVAMFAGWFWLSPPASDRDRRR